MKNYSFPIRDKDSKFSLKFKCTVKHNHSKRGKLLGPKNHGINMVIYDEYEDLKCVSK